jgi:hypothetical protein
VILGFLDLLPHHAQGLFQELGGFLTIRPPLNPTASILISPVVPMMISMDLFIFILYPHEHEFDGPILLLAA